MRTIFQDVRYAIRLLRRRPVLSATAILTLMLGMGGTTAMFSLLDALLIRNLPVERPDDLVRLTERNRDGTLAEAFTLITQDTLQRGTRTLSGVIASSAAINRPLEIKVDDEPRRAYVQFVSDNYFDVLGVRALRGRLFYRSEVTSSTAPPIAVISEEYWRRQYGGDPGVLGKRFRQGTHDFTIGGIAEPGFRGAELDSPVDIWIPVERTLTANDPERTRGRWMRVMGRLRPGVTRSQAEAEASVILGRPVLMQPGGIGYSTLRVRLYQPLLLVALAAGLVLLIACANLANLMLAATLSREREFSVRTAIGASRGRIFRQLATESVVLSAAGAALGLVLAWWISRALLAFLPPEQAVALPNLQFELDARVLGFVALLSAGTCLLFGAMPALRVIGSISGSTPKARAGTHSHSQRLMTRGLLIGQVVMCTALLIVAGVFFRTVQNLRGQQAGYLEDRLLIADVDFPRDYPEARRDHLIEDLRARAAALPGVEVAAFSHVGHLSGSVHTSRITFPGLETPSDSPADTSADDRSTVVEQRISPGFLRAMGTPLRVGREFAASDDERAPLVAIVNDSFVRRFLPGGRAIGTRFMRERGPRAGEPIEIVGVVEDSKWVNLRDGPEPMYYRPYRQNGGTPTVRLVVRSSEHAGRDALPRHLLTVAHSIDKHMRLSNVVPFSEVVDRTLVRERLVAQVSTAFGVLALMIAAVGLYGVLAYAVARRRREIGVRIAIGAQPGAIERMFLRESLVLVTIGVAVGILFAIAVTRSVSSMLFGLTPHDPASIVIAIATLMAVAGAATWLPARRAARIDPLIALRGD